MGCWLAPFLFIVCTDYIMSGVMKIYAASGRPGITICPRQCRRTQAIEECDQEYADDTVLYCPSVQDLAFLHDVFKVAFEHGGLKLNPKKCKTMFVNCEDQQKLLPYEEVTQYKYLGSIVSTLNSNSATIAARKKATWGGFHMLSEFWKSETARNEKL